MKKLSMRIIKSKRKVVTRDEAKAFFKDDPYKLELIDAIPEDENVTLYSQGNLLIYVEGSCTIYV